MKVTMAIDEYLSKKKEELLDMLAEIETLEKVSAALYADELEMITQGKTEEEINSILLKRWRKILEERKQEGGKNERKINSEISKRCLE